MKFRLDGVYIKKHDILKEGYDTWNNGKFIRNKYGILDKLYDIYRYGKTMDVSYSYIYFYTSKIRTISEVYLYMGSISGELTSILSNFKSTSYFGTNFHRDDYELVNDEFIKYKDSLGRSCSLTLLRDGNLIIKDFIDFVTEEDITDEFKFYPLS
jgi:hypothetical protein